LNQELLIDAQSRTAGLKKGKEQRKERVKEGDS
jgi:hypothetical protein